MHHDYQFLRTWREMSDATGHYVERVAVDVFGNDPDTAAAAHARAIDDPASWVRPGWRQPFVGDLELWNTVRRDDGRLHRRRVDTIRPGTVVDEILHEQLELGDGQEEPDR